MQAIDELLKRWLDAGLLDGDTAGRIRAFENARQPSFSVRWQSIVALAMGAMLLAAGICLFVAAHWDELGPMSRFALVLAMLTLLHTGATLSRERFPHLATALHGVGTAAAGAAISLAGQIFNLQENWPAGILLWLLCALAGWWLLRDQVQETMTWLLAPAWLLAEWHVRTDGYRGADLMANRILLMIAALYLLFILRPQRKLVSYTLFGVAAPVMMGTVALEDPMVHWRGWANDAAMPHLLQLGGWLLVLAPIVRAWRFRRTALGYMPVVLLAALLLPHCFTTSKTCFGGRQLEHNNAAFYACAAILAAFTAWWGLRERSLALVNYGVAAFGLCVLWFYLSDVMDKMGRSLSLMVLGVLFVAGGWLLEKTRRRLVQHMQEPVP